MEYEQELPSSCFPTVIQFSLRCFVEHGIFHFVASFPKDVTLQVVRLRYRYFHFLAPPMQTFTARTRRAMSTESNQPHCFRIPIYLKFTSFQGSVIFLPYPHNFHFVRHTFSDLLT